MVVVGIVREMLQKGHVDGGAFGGRLLLGLVVLVVQVETREGVRLFQLTWLDNYSIDVKRLDPRLILSLLAGLLVWWALYKLRRVAHDPCILTRLERPTL